MGNIAGKVDASQSHLYANHILKVLLDSMPAQKMQSHSMGSIGEVRKDTETLFREAFERSRKETLEEHYERFPFLSG